LAGPFFDFKDIGGFFFREKEIRFKVKLKMGDGKQIHEIIYL